jgi:hypothetical protein
VYKRTTKPREKAYITPVLRFLNLCADRFLEIKLFILLFWQQQNTCTTNNSISPWKFIVTPARPRSIPRSVAR